MDAFGVVNHSSTVQGYLQERRSVSHYDRCERPRTLALCHRYYDAFARRKYNWTPLVCSVFRIGHS